MDPRGMMASVTAPDRKKQPQQLVQQERGGGVTPPPFFFLKNTTSLGLGLARISTTWWYIVPGESGTSSSRGALRGRDGVRSLRVKRHTNSFREIDNHLPRGVRAQSCPVHHPDRLWVCYEPVLHTH